jgi:magnesium-transporting ATPase (P-type)
LGNDEPVPADMIIICTTDIKGGAFVETKNLDGETNLKLKSTQKELKERFNWNDENLN